MKKTALIASLMAALMTLTGCGEDSQTWRQKLRVVVSTPTGDVSGEAVSEGFIKVRGGTETLGRGAGVGGSITNGEATVINLGNGRYLFALLDGTGDGSWYLPFYTFLDGFPSAKWTNYVEAAHEFVQVKFPREVPRKHYPMLVTFGNINDPKTVREVKPTDLSNNFGTGYVLKSITLEITDEAVTTGKIAESIPWIISVNGRIKPIGRPIPRGYIATREEQLYSTSFIRGN
jgi:hypothetical protein